MCKKLKKHKNIMNNLKDFNTFNEGVARYSEDTKKERTENQKKYFTDQLVKRGVSKKKLDTMTIAELGKLLNTMKKDKR